MGPSIAAFSRKGERIKEVGKPRGRFLSPSRGQGKKKEGWLSEVRGTKNKRGEEWNSVFRGKREKEAIRVEVRAIRRWGSACTVILSRRGREATRKDLRGEKRKEPLWTVSSH